MAPWKGPRHKTWASDTFIATVVAAFVVVTYVVWEIVGTAPQGMITLVGVAGGALFGAVSGDKKKRERDTEETAQEAKTVAERAEAAANRAVEESSGPAPSGGGDA